MDGSDNPAPCLAVLQLTDPRSGRLGAAALRSAVAAALAGGHTRVAVDLSCVALLDAEALGELAAAFTRLTCLGGTLVLIEPQAYVRRVLSVTRLDSVLPIWSDSEAAWGESPVLEVGAALDAATRHAA